MPKKLCPMCGEAFMGAYGGGGVLLLAVQHPRLSSAQANRQSAAPSTGHSLGACRPAQDPAPDFGGLVIRKQLTAARATVRELRRLGRRDCEGAQSG